MWPPAIIALIESPLGKVWGPFLVGLGFAGSGGENGTRAGRPRAGATKGG